MRALTRVMLPVLVLGMASVGLLGHADAFAVGTHLPRGPLAEGHQSGAIPAVTTSVMFPARAPSALVVTPRPLPGEGDPVLAPPRRTYQADLLVVARTTLPAGVLARVRRLPGVAAAVLVDAGRVRVDGVFVDVLGVDPAAFRPFAARPAARSAGLWSNVAAGGVAVSYTMGKQDKISLTRPVPVSGARRLRLPVAGFGTVGIGDVNAVVSRQVGARIGLPAANAIVISAPRTSLAALMARARKVLPAKAAIAPLVTQVEVGGAEVTSTAAGMPGGAARQGPGLSALQIARFLAAARSRLGMPYVWGAAGPDAFDCSGLVQWSLARAGVVMPRVAADQARTGPLVPLSQLRPGDLLFYHTDPTAPGYISHVAIYLGNDLMIQAPEPGMTVQIVPADFGAGFAGAVRVYPRIAAAVAANPAG